MKNDDFIITYLSPIKKLKKFLADLVLVPQIWTSFLEYSYEGQGRLTFYVGAKGM